MAFQLDVNRSNIEVVLFKDSAVKCTRDEYDEYVQSFNDKDGPHEDMLRMVDAKEATRFILRRSIPFAQKQNLRSKNIKLTGNDVELDVNYSTDLVRAALIEVKNPDSVPDTKAIRFKRDKDGLASSDLINMLDEAGVLNDLVAAYTNATATQEKDQGNVAKN